HCRLIEAVVSSSRDKLQVRLDRYGATSPKLFGSVACGTVSPGSDIDIFAVYGLGSVCHQIVLQIKAPRGVAPPAMSVWWPTCISKKSLLFSFVEYCHASLVEPSNGHAVLAQSSPRHLLRYVLLEFT